MFINTYFSTCLTEYFSDLPVQIAQVRVLFKLPSTILPDHPHLLAYCEWFDFTKTTPYADCGLYRVRRALDATNQRMATVIRVDQIIRSCHLVPYNPGQTAWRSATVLEKCKSFYLNKYLDGHTFVSIS